MTRMDTDGDEATAQREDLCELCVLCGEVLGIKWNREASPSTPVLPATGARRTHPFPSVIICVIRGSKAPISNHGSHGWTRMETRRTDSMPQQCPRFGSVHSQRRPDVATPIPFRAVRMFRGSNTVRPFPPRRSLRLRAKTSIPPPPMRFGELIPLRRGGAEKTSLNLRDFVTSCESPPLRPD